MGYRPRVGGGVVSSRPVNRILHLAVLGGVFGLSAWAGFLLTEPPAEPASAAQPLAWRPPSEAPPPAEAAPAPVPEPVPVEGEPLGDLDGRGPAPEKPGEPLRVTFNDLSQWDLDPKSVQVPRSILAMGGKSIDIVGYMIPYGDPDSVVEFALVRDLGSCCFGQAPQPHHVIECRLPEGRKTAYVPGPVRVRGRFRVEEHRQGQYLISIYSMVVEDCTEVR